MIWDLIKYLFYGLVQGFTEPLPISSSGHLVLLRYLFNTDAFSDLNFEIFLNFASLLAIMFIFRHDIIELIRGFILFIVNKDNRKNEDIRFEFKYCLLIVVGSIPAGIAGIVFKDFIENTLGSNIKFLGVSFLITALLLYIVKDLKGKRNDRNLNIKDAIIIGLCQMVALIPGISRSGATLVGCLFRGLTKDSSLKYTFMLYLPVSLGSFLLDIKDIMSIESNLILPYIVGFIATLLMTYAASLWFFNIVRRGKLYKFSIYLVLLGLITILFI